MAYKDKRSGYVSELTKVIKIKEYLNKNEISKIDSYNYCLAVVIDKIRRVSSKLNALVCNDDAYEELLQFCTNQELRAIELRNSIYSVVPEFNQGPISHDQTFVTKTPKKAYLNPIPRVAECVEIAKVPRSSSLKSLDVKETFISQKNQQRNHLTFLN